MCFCVIIRWINTISWYFKKIFCYALDVLKYATYFPVHCFFTSIWLTMGEDSTECSPNRWSNSGTWILKPQYMTVKAKWINQRSKAIGMYLWIWDDSLLVMLVLIVDWIITYMKDIKCMKELRSVNMYVIYVFVKQ